MTGDARASSDQQQSGGGAVELREDVPLKAGGAGGAGAAGCARGPRLIAAAFAALSAAVTLALLTQIYYGDYEVVPHGAVSSDAAACSRAGADALKAGGRALDAAAAAALCLAVLAPHRTSLDASGALLYWEYRTEPLGEPSAVEWGGPDGSAGGEQEPVRPPRLVAALAALHARRGALPWTRLLQPALDLARDGFVVSEELAALEGGAAGARRAAPQLAAYLQTLQLNSSKELTAGWGGEARALRRAAAGRLAAGSAGGWRGWAAGAGAAPALAALAAALAEPTGDPDAAQLRAVQSLQAAAAGDAWAGGGVAAGLAAVDGRDAYVALVTGLSMPFGNGATTAAGWRADHPTAPLDLAPAILADQQVCGTRYVMGAESGAALAQAGAALAGGAAGGVERARLALLPGGALAAEPAAPPPPALAAAAAPAVAAARPYAAVNVVQQRADALLSHADSRGGGLASRF